MSFGSSIVDDISRHIRDCKTCTSLRPTGVNDSNTRQALKQCTTYASLYRDWKRWVATVDFQ